MRKYLVLLFLLVCTGSAFAQISVDTAKGIVTVKNKVQNVIKTLNIYTSIAPDKNKMHQIVYTPDNVDYDDEDNTLRLTFSTESAYIKAMLDAANKQKHYNFTRLSINIAAYKDLVSKLADIYANSQEWNDYLKKATNLHRVYKLYDGNEVTEISYDPAKALAVLTKSDFLQSLNSLFSTYGYQLALTSFPDDHQRILTADELKKLGKSETLFIPLPENSFTLTKIKK